MVKSGFYFRCRRKHLEGFKKKKLYDLNFINKINVRFPEGLIFDDNIFFGMFFSMQHE